MMITVEMSDSSSTAPVPVPKGTPHMSASAWMISVMLSE
jgi:hypothetical protein